MNPDVTAFEQALDRQLTVLGPVAARLHAADMHPLIAPHDWRGPASAAYRDLEAAMRDRIRRAAEATEGAVHETRRARAAMMRLADVQVPDV